ncbi:tyrosine-type recombinase/integrase [Amycolatopsis sp. NPDC051373]|uniref:tyrosine-type recombinase/integrase n=1 Tax=Amycolatopsis sp. NPDC051373 TaxID=3155801 RepID=UPI00344D64B0
MSESLETLWSSFELELRAAGRSLKTLETYHHAVRGFSQWLIDQGRDPVDDELTRDNVRQWLVHLRETRSQNTVATRHAGLSRFCKWRVREGVAETDPMQGLPIPEWFEPPVPVLTDDQLSALVKTCATKASPPGRYDPQVFRHRRDEAAIRLLADAGPRVAEMCSIQLDDLDLTGQAVGVMGKGQRPRMLYLSGFRTVQSLDRYLRERGKHPLHHLPDLFLGLRGPLTPGGVRQMLHARGELIGIADLHPHMLRHTKAHDHQMAGGNVLNLQRQMGWTSDRMVKRYGASAADARAREEAKRLQRGDRF